ncbi:putative short-subunit dehydrogenase-like oxidoreductase (DUF2520 family) [Lutibacter sp. Hel_I_33_5]|uniref:Rossmann-like and DUF2520 domain-containing protein n=1 Tax=Lutibacter sp. Hel_I_33_5 TaxID=1566289 RepID=UPI0011A40ABD|nr:Rossmann-like and DUF2520 domain-containing protein [Lutibacter sp. Hel_I_33_5]TVZ54822.1 putative short-subunit dehydrogenase-like oxidoreductase (DUF2520 family) [Lutibacter sp. Hel_I_33_5]
MISVVIIGKGNVATHLTNAFKKADKVNVSSINSRKLKDIPTADITIIAVSDDAIEEVSSKVTNSFVVHTSGSASIKSLKNNTRKGVFYPLQTFTKGKKVDFNEIPFCLETENEKDLKLLEKAAKTIGTKIFSINTKQRKALHVAAVFVNNFTNHLYKTANDICKDQNVPFEILLPLIKETANKVEQISPKKAQTGPAIRNDKKTIKNHLDLLNKEQQEIYTLLTNSIQHGEKL